MSLITLTSEQNAQNPQLTDPAILRNHFKDGIKIRKGSEIGLVSISINKESFFTIVAGVSDTFTWRYGNRNDFIFHKVTITPGDYTGTQLAAELQRAANESIILQNFEFVSEFDGSEFNGDGGFVLTIQQVDVPDQNANTFEATSVDGTITITTASEIKNETDSGGKPVTKVRGDKVEGEFSDTGGDNDVAKMMINGKRSLFANGGESSIIIPPKKSITQKSLEDKITAASGSLAVQFSKLAEPVRDATATILSSGTQFDNGYDVKITFASGSPAQYYLAFGRDGKIGLDEDGSTLVGPDLDDSDDVNAGVLFYNVSTGHYQDVDAGGRSSNNAGAGLRLMGASGSSLGLSLNNYGYGKNICGCIRDVLHRGPTTNPGVALASPNFTFAAGNDMGFSYMLQVRDDVDLGVGDGINVGFGYIKRRSGIDFPNTNWKADSVVLDSALAPTSWNSLPGTAPANWSSFTYPNDHIRVKFAVSKVKTLSVFISHDTAGNGTFIEEVELYRAGLGNFPLNLKESSYPLRPQFALSRGSSYEATQYQLQGIFEPADAKTHALTEADMRTNGHTFVDEATLDDEFSVTSGTTTPSNAMTLSGVFIFGAIGPLDIGTPDRQLNSLDVPADRNENNIARVIGFPNFFQGSAAAGSQAPFYTISSANNGFAPTPVLLEPTIYVNLDDFNIKGHVGATNDTSKLIAVIPAEELFTSEKSGLLTYYAQFPIMIDLNIPYDQTYYDLNISLRDTQGKILRDLLPDTNMTLLLKESDEERQRRLMKEQTELLVSAMANRNDALEDAVGRNNPKL